MHVPSAPIPVPRAWPFKGVYYGWSIVIVGAVSGLASACMFGPVLSIFVTPISEELGWSRATISIAFSAGTIVGSFASGAIGSFVDRHGTRVVVVGAGLLMAVAMVIIATMTEPWHFWLGVGLGRGGALAGVLFSNSVNIARWFVRQRGRAQAIAGTGLRVGQVILPLVIYGVMAVAGWRESFIVLGAIILAGVVLPGAIYLRSYPEAMGLLPDGDSAHPSPNTPTSGRQRITHETEVQWSLQEAARTRAFWLLVVVIGGTYFVNGAVNLHAVAHFQDRGLSTALAVSIVTVFALTTVVAAMLWGFICERIHVRWATIATALTYLLSMLVIVNADTYPAAVLFGIMFGMASGGWSTLERLLMPNYFGRRSAGAIGGVKEMVVGVISPIGPITAGLVRDLTGSYIPAFILFAAVALLLVVAMLLAAPPRKPA